MKKRFVAGLLVLTCAVSVTATVAGESMLKSARFASDTSLQVFGKSVETDILSAEKAGVEGAMNYVSARALAEHLGYQVEWDENKKVISVGVYPQYDIKVSQEDFDKVKIEFEPLIEKLLSKFSPREFDSLRKESTYVLKLLDGDPAEFGLLLVEDYKKYKEGGESAYSNLWIDLEKP